MTERKSMNRLIVSEQHAEQIGRNRTNGKQGKDFTVFSYIHPASRLTCFAVEIKRTDEIVTVW